MSDVPPLDSYHLFDTDRSYEQLREEFEWTVPDSFNAAEYVCDRWATDSPRTALLVEDAEAGLETHTFSDLERDSNRLANALAAAGVASGDRVAVCGSQHAEVVHAHLAAWKLGAVSVPLSVLLGPDGLTHRVSDAEASAIVAHRSMVPEIKSARAETDALETVFLFGAGESDEFQSLADVSSHSSTLTIERTSPDQPALLNYTSGTTGQPKGVVHGHESVLGSLPTFIQSKLNMARTDEDLTRTIVEWSWTGAFNNNVLPSLFLGVPLLGYVGGGQFDPKRELDLIERHGVTVFNCPPTAIRMLRDADLDPTTWDLTSVRTVATGGESVDLDLIEWTREAFPEAAVHEVYGQTEAPTFLGDCTALGITHRDDRMGKPSVGHEVRVVDQGNPTETVEPGTVGELAIDTEGNPLCFQEYWNRPAATDEKIVDGWLLTEDLVRVDDEGYYSFCSRKDDVIISSGYRISPAEIEQCLSNHDTVAQAGVVGKPDDARGAIPVAFVVLDGDQGRDRDGIRSDLKAHVKSTLAKYEYPREITFVDDIATTTSGKVKRDDLEQRLVE